MPDYYQDPLLPTCLKSLPKDWNHVFEWVCETIRKMPPTWWQRASQVYSEQYNFVGVFVPHKEVNQRLYRANRWLRMQIEKHVNLTIELERV